MIGGGSDSDREPDFNLGDSIHETQGKQVGWTSDQSGITVSLTHYRIAYVPVNPPPNCASESGPSARSPFQSRSLKPLGHPGMLGGWSRNCGRTAVLNSRLWRGHLDCSAHPRAAVPCPCSRSVRVGFNSGLAYPPVARTVTVIVCSQSGSRTQAQSEGVGVTLALRQQSA